MQATGRAVRDQRADLALDLERMRTLPGMLARARRGGKHRVDQRRERSERGPFGPGLALDQHEREVMAQAGQVAVGGERRRPQALRVERLELGRGASPGQEKRDLCFARHIHRARPNVNVAARS